MQNRLSSLVMVAAMLLLFLPGLTPTASAAETFQPRHTAGPVVEPPPAFLAEAARGPLLPRAAAVTATVVLQSRNPAGLAAYANEAATPGSPLFRHWLSPAAVLRRFGPLPATTAAVVRRLRAAGFTVVPHTWTLTVTGSAAQWTRLLDTQLRWYRYRGVRFRAQATAARLPAWLAAGATGVTGLTTYAPPAPLLTIPRLKPFPVVRNLHLRPMRTTAHIVKATTTTFSQNFSVTAMLAGPTTRTTGLPIHVVFQASLDGQPDLTAGVGPSSFAGSTSTGQSPYGWALSGIGGGYTVVGIISPYALTAQIQVTVYAELDQQGNPVQGSPSVTITLPPLTWSGPAQTLNALDAEQINALYDGSALLGEGPHATVGIIAVAPPSKGILGALQSFVAANQLPSPTVTTVQVTQGKVPAGWSSETDMDLQAAETTAPGAHIIVYADPTLDLGAFFQAIVNQPVPVVSLSLGGSGIDSSIASVVAAAGAEGVTVCVSSGDFGSESGAFPTTNPPQILPPAVSEPADLVPVTAVGGTDVAVDALTNQAAATTAWGGEFLSLLPPLAQEEVLWSYAATGGGYSQTQPIPSWQATFLPTGATGRGVPDIALLADPYVAGILMWSQTGGQEVGGGTSLGAPLLAGWTADMAAMIKKPVGNLDPLLYQLATQQPAIFTQASTGDNGAYQITTQDNEPGTWNPLTGLGSPDIAQLASAVVNATTSTASVGVSFSQPSVAMPGMVVISASGVNLPSPQYELRIETPWNLVWHTYPWQTSPWWQYQAPVAGTYGVQVVAKTGSGTTVASPVSYIQFTTTSPAVTNLVVSTTPPGPRLPAGTSVTVKADATDPHGKAEYQFRVETPAKHWIVGPWSTTATATYHNLKPGQWTFVVLAHDTTLPAKQGWQTYRRSVSVTVVATPS